MDFGLLKCSPECHFEHHQTISSCCQKVEQFSWSCLFPGDAEFHLLSQIDSFLEQVPLPYSHPQVAVVLTDSHPSVVSTQDNCLGFLLKGQEYLTDYSFAILCLNHRVVNFGLLSTTLSW